MFSFSETGEEGLSLTEHLDELRTRIICAGIAILAPTAIAFFSLWGMIRALLQFFPRQVDFLPSADDYILPTIH